VTDCADDGDTASVRPHHHLPVTSSALTWISVRLVCLPGIKATAGYSD